MANKEVWRVELGGPWNGGTLSTAGNLVFQGNARGEFAAYRADTGERMWSSPTQAGILAPPITYEVDGVQWLGGTAVLPVAEPAAAPALDAPPDTATPAMVTEGKALYHHYCGTCHGDSATGAGVLPDLRYSVVIHSAEAFDTIVRQGARVDKGMVAFKDEILPQDLRKYAPT